MSSPNGIAKGSPTEPLSNPLAIGSRPEALNMDPRSGTDGKLCKLVLVSAHPEIVFKVEGQQVSFQFRNEGFFPWARPHPPSLSSYGGTRKWFSPRRTCGYAAPIERDRHAETRGLRLGEPTPRRENAAQGEKSHFWMEIS